MSTNQSGEVRVDRYQVGVHAVAVDRIGDAVALAAQAVQVVRLDTDAYGIFCRAIPAMLDSLSASVAVAVTNAAADLHALADQLRTASDNYCASDEQAAARFQQAAQR